MTWPPAIVEVDFGVIGNLVTIWTIREVIGRVERHLNLGFYSKETYKGTVLNESRYSSGLARPRNKTDQSKVAEDEYASLRLLSLTTYALMNDELSWRCTRFQISLHILIESRRDIISAIFFLPLLKANLQASTSSFTRTCVFSTQTHSLLRSLSSSSL